MTIASDSMVMPTARRWLSLAALSFIVTGCGTCDEPTKARLEITAPSAGASLGSADDVDPSTPGLQYDVVVSASGLGEGEVVRLYTNAAVVDADPNALTPFEAVLGSAATVTIRATLPEGASSLVACARANCSVRSATVDVTVGLSGCPSVAYTSPAPGTGTSVTLGPADDADGMGCGLEFQTKVTAVVGAVVGTGVSLVVNGAPAATAMVGPGGVVDFGNVTLGNRGDTPNTLEIHVSGADSSCLGAFGKPLMVDCAGPSCAITAPDSTNGYLNSSNDTDSTVPGLQTDMTVTASSDAAGHSVTLVVDANASGARTATATASGSTALGQFPGVPLSEGAHTVQATCSDGAGNTTLSSVVAWTVDTIPCVPAFTAPTQGQLVDTSNDADSGTPGIQLATAGSLNGADCSEFRVADCGAIAASPFGPSSGATFASTVTLGTSASQSICVDARDAAGNLRSASVDVLVDSAGPYVNITAPVANTKFNVAGTAGGVADLTPATAACDIAVSADCSAIGTAVELYVNGDTTALASANCATDSGSSLGGSAHFASVALPTSTTSFVLVAKQAAGASTPIALTGLCQAPSLSIASPMCGATLGPANDTDAATPGVQADVSVNSPNSPQLDVVLTISPAVGSGSYTATSPAASASGNVHVFPDADFDSNGVRNVVATATDAFGNLGTSPSCQVTVATPAPTLTVTAPTNNLTINAANAASFDCDGNTSNVDVLVTATTDATNGSAASVQVGSATPIAASVSAGAISVCVPLTQQGTLSIVVSVSDTDGTDGIVGDAVASPVTITVLTQAPNALGPFTISFADHDAERAGTATIQFAPVADALGNPLASYELRCATTAIDSQADWNAATVRSFGGTTPSLANPQTLVAGGFRTGTVHYCLVRGVDAAGNQTPMPATGTSALVAPQFDSVSVTSASGRFLGYGGIVAVGDVTGDGRSDFLVGGRGSAALYFGGTDLSRTAPDVLFVSTMGGSAYFGMSVAGIGDWNGDGRPDFAIGSYSENNFDGAVYVFFGKASAAAWSSALVSVGTTGCDADACIRPATNSGAGLGQSVAAVGNFDGDATPDFALAASGLNQAIVVSGGQTVPMDRTFVLGTNDPNGFAIQGTPSAAGSFDFGLAVVALGDANQNGFQDVGVLRAGLNADFTPNLTRPIVLYRVDGRTRATSGLTTISGSSDVVPVFTDPALVGYACTSGVTAAIGVLDFDDDGLFDITCATDVSQNLGHTYVAYGAANGTFALATSTRIESSMHPQGDLLGSEVGSDFNPTLGFIGDIDQDGIFDLLLGSQEQASANLPTGVLVYGRTSRPATIDWLTDGETARLGASPVPVGITPRRGGFVGDVNGDGNPDLVLADPYDSGYANAHGTFVLLY